MSTIALIETDALFRSLLALWLADAGYRVITTELHAEPHAADLVIVDVYMPRQGDNQRLRAVRAAYPAAPVVAISGQFWPGLQCAGPAAQAMGVARVMAKPFGREALLDVVRSLIGPPHAERAA